MGKRGKINQHPTIKIELNIYLEFSQGRSNAFGRSSQTNIFFANVQSDIFENLYLL